MLETPEAQARDLESIANKVFFELEYSGRPWLGNIEIPPIRISPEMLRESLRKGITVGDKRKGITIYHISLNYDEIGKRYKHHQKTAEVEARIYWNNGEAYKDYRYTLRKTGNQWEIYINGGN